MRTLILLLILISFSCKKPVSQNQNYISTIDSTNIILQNNELTKQRYQAETLAEYLKIGKKLDTIVKSYAELKFDSVVAINHLYIGMRLSSDTSKVDTIKKCLVLNAQQAEKLVKTLDSKETFDRTFFAKCSEPHMTFIFLHKNEIVAHSSVCLRCSNIGSTIKLIGESKFLSISNYGEKMFSDLCKNLKFSDCR